MTLEHIHLFVLAIAVPVTVLLGVFLLRGVFGKRDAVAEQRMRLVYDMASKQVMTPAQYGAKKRIEQTARLKAQTAQRQHENCCEYCGRDNARELSEACPGCGAPR